MKKLCFILIVMMLTACSTNKKEEAEMAKNKKIAEINVQLGAAYLEQGDTQRAKQKLLYAIDKSPQLPEAWYTMAYFHEVTGNKAEAKADYLRAITLGPNRGDAHNNYGTFLCRSGEYMEAIQHFVTATRDPQYLDTAGAYENAGICALKIPDKQLATQYFSLALENDPTRQLSITELNKLRDA